MRNGPDATHRGWLRFQFSYCNENCISVNRCGRNYLPAVTCDSITPRLTWWARMPPGTVAEAPSRDHLPRGPQDATDGRRRRFRVGNEARSIIWWWFKTVVPSPTLFLWPFLHGSNLWFPAGVLQDARWRSTVISDGITFRYLLRAWQWAGASFTFSLIISIILCTKDCPPVLSFPFFLNNIIIHVFFFKRGPWIPTRRPHSPASPVATCAHEVIVLEAEVFCAVLRKCPKQEETCPFLSLLFSMPAGAWMWWLDVNSLLRPWGGNHLLSMVKQREGARVADDCGGEFWGFWSPDLILSYQKHPVRKS